MTYDDSRVAVERGTTTQGRTIVQLNRPTSRSFGVVIAACALLASTTASAAGTSFDNMFPTQAGQTCSSGLLPCQTDNYSLTVYAQSSVDSSTWAEIKFVLDVQYNPTDLNVIFASTPVYTGSAETDIIYRIDASKVPSGAGGYTYCDDPLDPYKCDQQYVTFRSASDARNDGMSCHETGHAVGLLHGANSNPSISNTDPALGCMATPVSSSAGLGSHNSSEINATY